MEDGTLSAELDAAVALKHDLVRVIREYLGLPETVAVPMAEHLAVGLCRARLLTEWRTIPASEERQAVRGAIAREFTGNNVGQLMRRYKVSRATVYRAVRSAKTKAGAPAVSKPSQSREK